MASWKMHCIYDTPDEEKKAIKVDEDNWMSVSDAVDEGTPAGPWYVSNVHKIKVKSKTGSPRFSIM
jgi:hypothetical protein